VIVPVSKTQKRISKTPSFLDKTEVRKISAMRGACQQGFLKLFCFCNGCRYAEKTFQKSKLF
jgi:hypothetical protein